MIKGDEIDSGRVVSGGAYHNCARDAPSCEQCKHIMQFGKRKYCAYVPPRCTLRECVKGVAQRCIWCKHYHKNLTSEVCAACLASDNLCNFVVQDIVKETYETLYGA